MRVWTAILAAACVLASAIGLVAVYAAIQHNPQGEFVNHETGAVNYPGLSGIFLSWFLAVGLAAGIALALVAWAVRGLRMLYRLLRGQFSN